MTPAEILAEARRWDVDISPSDARILNFASWVRAMAMEEAAQMFEALGKDLAASQVRALRSES